MKYTLTLTESQARTISRAVEFYSRSFLGQLDLWHVSVDGQTLGYKERGAVECLLKNMMNLSRGESFGIYSDKIPDEARVAWDIRKVIDYRLWMDGDRAFRGVNSYPPDQSGKEPLAKIKKEDDK